MSLRTLNPQAETTKMALMTNVRAALGLQDVLRTNLGPRGTLKMLVGGAGDIKLTKDGNVLLHQMQIQHPTASLLARTATSQDEMVGDGTTSAILIIGELFKQAFRVVQEGLHPRVVADGFELARVMALEYLDDIKVVNKKRDDRELLLAVARAALRTKVHESLADRLTEIVTDAILTIRPDQADDEATDAKPIDLFMVEIQEMQHQADMATRLVRGLVLDHGPRHPQMPKRVQGDVYILTCNVSLEYEKSEVNAGLFYESAAQRQEMVDEEHRFVNDRVRKIIELKREVCGDSDQKHFVLINQKGIDPESLQLLANEGIMALRRAKRRNMERLTLCCGGKPMNNLDDLSIDCLGKAGLVYEQVIGEEKFTFIEEVAMPKSVTILIKGSTKHSIAQTKDAVRDGLRAVKNTIEDGCVVPGGGAFYIGAHKRIMERKDEVSGRAKMGVVAFAEALLVIPKTLAQNSGLDAIDCVLALQEEFQKGATVGLDLYTGDPMSPALEGIWDGYRVIRSILHSSVLIAGQLLQVDELIAAGGGGGGGGEEQLPPGAME